MFTISTKCFFNIAVTGSLIGLLAACEAIPNVNPMLETSQPVRIETADAALDARQSNALLVAGGVRGRKLTEMERHLAIEQTLDDTPLVADNKITLLRDGKESFPAIFAAILNARHHVNLEYYIFEDIKVNGLKLSDLLLQKRREGVAINVIYDSYGSDETPDAFFDKLRNAGVNLVSYNPLNPFNAVVGWAPDARDHRKIMVADGSLAITGGVNLSKTYLNGPGKSQQGEKSKNSSEGNANDALPVYWRDTDIKIEGPAVAQLQKLFMTHWQAQQGSDLSQADYFPRLKKRGSAIVHVMGSSPDKVKQAYYATLVSAIRTSQYRVWIHTAYFVPTVQERHALVHAAQRGVDVRIILPEKSDSNLAIAFQRSTYGNLLAAGVKLYEIHNVVLHSKTATIDGVWSVVGSSNFDHRSVILNDEVDTVVIGKDFTAEMEDLFQTDLVQSIPVNLDDWKNRDFFEHVKEAYATLVEDEL